ncbi:MAG: response regulator transcription factor [Nodosilinea sp. LVE1205-7]|jgi:two-component system OmpR family response regulator
MLILIVEDEAEIARLIQLYLEKEGFTCHICDNGEAALDYQQSLHPDLVILDLMLPKLDGLEVCARIRQSPGAKDPYILMLTARGEEIDRVIGLSTGADDYLVKPFSPRELVARVRALLRRSLRHRQDQTDQSYQTTHFTLNLERRTAQRQIAKGITEWLDLTPLEFNLLATFMSYPGRVWSRHHLIEKLWGEDFFGDERVVDTHIARLRKKIESDPSQPTYVKTVTGVGYRFEDEASLTAKP